MAKQKGTPKPVILDAVQIAPGKYQAVVPPAEEPTEHTYTWDFTAESVAGTPVDLFTHGWSGIQGIIRDHAWQHPMSDAMEDLRDQYTKMIEKRISKAMRKALDDES
jgi:hypothetical protein